MKPIEQIERALRELRARPEVRHVDPPDIRWWVDSYGWAWINTNVKLTPDEIKEITHQAMAVKPGKPN